MTPDCRPDWKSQTERWAEPERPEPEPEPELTPSRGAAVLANQAREHGRDLVGRRQQRFVCPSCVFTIR